MREDIGKNFLPEEIHIHNVQRTQNTNTKNPIYKGANNRYFSKEYTQISKRYIKKLYIIDYREHASQKNTEILFFFLLRITVIRKKQSNRC